MMTVAEAMNRCRVNGVRLQRTGSRGEWLVTLANWTAQQVAILGYTTDDLEDAVIMGGKLRRNA